MSFDHTPGIYPTFTVEHIYIAPPNDLTATAMTSNSITMSWSKPWNAVSYVLYRAVSSGGTYTVTYYGNGSDGGTVPTDGNNYEENTEITVVAAGTMTQTGYTFTGWNTAENGSRTARTAGSTFTMGTVNVPLYAQWEEVISEPGIYGTWYHTETSYGMTFEITIVLNSNGTFTIDIYMTGEPDDSNAGTFTYGDSTITLTYTDSTIETFDYTLNGDIFILITPDGSLTFIRL